MYIKLDNYITIFDRTFIYCFVCLYNKATNPRKWLFPENPKRVGQGKLSIVVQCDNFIV